jgi:hypothetical protein
MAEAREIGKQDGMDIVAIRTGQTMIQAGFVKKSNGIAKGMYSLASSLAGLIQDESWIGAFELPDGQYSLVAVHRGLIVPGCDVIGDKQEIRNFLIEKDSQVRGLKFEKVFHPDDFEYRGEQLLIDEILAPGRLKKDFALKQLTYGLTRREITTIGVAVLAVGAIALGVQQWFAYQARIEQAEAARKAQIEAARLALLRAQTGAETPPQALSHPWASKPSVHDFLVGCQGAINSLPLALGGWEFTSAICTGTTIETVYTRSKGAPTFAQFSLAATALFSSPAVLLEGGERAGLGDQVTLAAGGDDTLLATDDLRRLFLSHMQQMELKPDIADVPYVPPATKAALPGQPEPPPPPVPDWTTYTYAFSTTYSPETVFSSFGLDGVRLNEIAVSRGGDSVLTWSFKGEMYAH